VLTSEGLSSLSLVHQLAQRKDGNTEDPAQFTTQRLYVQPQVFKDTSPWCQETASDRRPEAVPQGLHEYPQKL
jgi:hypothetical protein